MSEQMPRNSPEWVPREPQPDSHVVLGGETGLLQVVSRLHGVLAAKEPPDETAIEERLGTEKSLLNIMCIIG
jgi:hypothetical protein